jgi:hypothetical protein
VVAPARGNRHRAVRYVNLALAIGRVGRPFDGYDCLSATLVATINALSARRRGRASPAAPPATPSAIHRVNIPDRPRLGLLLQALTHEWNAAHD